MTALPEGIATYERPDCAQVFFLFAGLGESLMMNPIQFLKETGLSDRNVVLLKDAAGTNYRCGISQAVPSFSALVEWQQEYVAARPHLREVYVAGTSAGGVAALRSGYQLAARQAWAFGARLPKEAIIPELRSQMSVLLGAKTVEEARQKFNAMSDTWRQEFFDLRESPARLIDTTQVEELVRMLSVPNGVTRYRIYYSPRSAVDTWMAGALEKLPDLTVERIEQPADMENLEFDTGHNVLRPLSHLGLLQHIFPKRVSA